jgi:para-aminobenzoate synthetase/4-amino-4-deoxychorismate lyase
VRLFEALLWEPGEGYFLLEHHLRRLGRSAAHFRYPADAEALRKELLRFAESLPERPRKVRLELSADGALFLEHVDVKPSARVRAVLARTPVDSADELLRHKTSRREVYERALAERPGFADVLLWNERCELTESCAANLVLELDGRRLTPALSSGLLAGTFRDSLISRGEIAEAVLPVQSLARASRLWLVNSVRRWCELQIEGATSS